MALSSKIRAIRKANKMTQSEFALSIGISRGNLANIELGQVKPTPVFLNCVSLMYNVDKNWLLDDNNDDQDFINGSEKLINNILEKYDQLKPPYKKFIEQQINQLLEIQHV